MGPSPSWRCSVPDRSRIPCFTGLGKTIRSHEKLEMGKTFLVMVLFTTVVSIFEQVSQTWHGALGIKVGGSVEARNGLSCPFT